jgi:signal transduction histidine kinase
LKETVTKLAQPPEVTDLFEGVTDIDVCRVVRELVHEHQHDWRSAGHTFECRLPQDSLIVRANDVWLKHAFGHFVRNAKHALNVCAGLKPTQLLVTVRREDQRVAIDFADTGGGMAPHVQKDIFNNAIDKSSAHGFGVGLMTARTILVAYGGDARLGDADGDGTRICVWLPLQEPHARRHAASPES